MVQIQGRWLARQRQQSKESVVMAKKGGLGKWFGEKWVDVKTGKPCGRSGKNDKRKSYPACRPKAVAGRISKSEARKKTGPKRVSWSVTASGKKRKKKT